MSGPAVFNIWQQQRVDPHMSPIGSAGDGLWQQKGQVSTLIGSLFFFLSPPSGLPFMLRMLRCVCDVAVMYLVGGSARTWVRFFVVLSTSFSLVTLALIEITIACLVPLDACLSIAIVGGFSSSLIPPFPMPRPLVMIVHR